MKLIWVQLLSFISQIIANVIDSVVIKRCLGPEAMAAFSFSNTATSIVVAVFGFLLTGVSILASRNASEPDARKRNSVFTTAVLLSVILGIILTVVGLCASHIIAALCGSPDELREMTAEYIRGHALGVLPLLLFAVFSATSLVDGGRKCLMASFAVMAGVDVVLDLAVGFGPHPSLWGIAVATSVSELAGFGTVLIFALKRRRLFRFVPRLFRPVHMKDVFSYGYMYVVKQLMITVLGFVFNNYIVRKYGSGMLAAFASALSAVGILECVASAIGNTVSTMNGFYAKVEDGTSMKSLMRSSVKYSVIINAVITGTAVLLAAPVMRLFYRADDAFAPAAVEAFRFLALSVTFRSINMSFRGYYQSMKMHKASLAFTFMQALGCIVLMLFLLDALIGARGIWLSYLAGEVLAFLAMAFVLRWKTGERNMLDAMMMMPPACRGEGDTRLDMSCHSMDEVMNSSCMAEAFCQKQGASRRVSTILSLAVEEIAGNTIRYGFGDGKPHSVDICVKKNNTDWVIWLHDDCAGFDPTKYLQDPATAGEHNGIRMIQHLASEVTYVSALGLNHLLIRVQPEGVN